LLLALLEIFVCFVFGVVENSTNENCRNADSPTKNEDGELLFVKPWEEQQDFAEFVDFVIKQEKEGRRQGEEVRYAQTRK
jgi:hypothetical protein